MVDIDSQRGFDTVGAYFYDQVAERRHLRLRHPLKTPVVGYTQQKHAAARIGECDHFVCQSISRWAGRATTGELDLLEFPPTVFAQFEPFSRTRTDDRGIQSWQPPGYSVFHLHTSYSLGDVLPIANGGSLRLFANVYNLFDTVYIQDATDASRFNGYHDDGDRHDADSAEVFLGYPRNLNVGFQIVF